MKTYIKKPIWKVYKYGALIFSERLVPFKYQLMHSIIFQFVAKILGFLVLFERQGGGSAFHSRMKLKKMHI